RRYRRRCSCRSVGRGWSSWILPPIVVFAPDLNTKFYETGCQEPKEKKPLESDLRNTPAAIRTRDLWFRRAITHPTTLPSNPKSRLLTRPWALRQSVLSGPVVGSSSTKPAQTIFIGITSVRRGSVPLS